MKASILTALELGVGLGVMGCSAGVNVDKKSFQTTGCENEAGYHVAVIQHHKSIARNLEGKIQGLEVGIARHTQNPTLDPKGLGVSGWKALKGAWQVEVQGFRERITWHTNEVARLAGSTKNFERLKDEATKKS